MAEAAQNVSISDLKENFLECPVCTEEFDQGARKPRFLYCCLHAFCSECLQVLLDRQATGYITCPLCRSAQKVEGDATTIPIEPVRCNLVEYLKRKRQESIMCSSCPDTRQATSRCQTCMEFLCKDCCFAHTRHMMTRNHIVSKLEDARGNHVKSESCRSCCEDHPELSVDFFCLSCDTLCCAYCKSINHKWHDITEVKKASEVKKAHMMEVLQDAAAKGKSLADKVEHCKKQTESLTSSEVKAVAAINGAFDQMVEAIEMRRSVLISEAAAETAQLVSVENDRLSSAQSSLAIIDSVNSYFASMNTQGSDIEFLQRFSTMNEAIESVVNMPHEIPDSARRSFEFHPLHSGIIRSMVSSVGQMRRVAFEETSDEKGDIMTIESDDQSEVTIQASFATQSNLQITSIPCLPQDQIVFLDGISNDDFDDPPVVYCPYMRYDPGTLSVLCTISPSGTLTNSPPQESEVDSNSTMKKYRGSVSDTALQGTGMRLWQVRIRYKFKVEIPTGMMAAEVALTSHPVDAAFQQIRQSSIILLSCLQHGNMCLSLSYNGRMEPHVLKVPNKANQQGYIDLGFLLEFGRQKLHVFDVDKSRVLGTLDNIAVSEPLWPTFFVISPGRGEMDMELISGHNIVITSDMMRMMRQALSQ